MSADFIHAEEYLDAGDIMELTCNTQCNFMLMDDLNFASYRRGDRFTYYGGHFKMFPAGITAPRTGHWHAVLDLGGGQANIRYSFRVIKCSSP